MKKLLLLLFLFIAFSASLNANNYVSSDLTYTCLGGNTYLITFSYYRDCSGGQAPANVQINFSCSSNSAFNYSAILIKAIGTGQEVTPACGCDSTTCQGGTSFGVREYVYQSQVTLGPCNKWKMWTNGCCRNTVSTVSNVGSNNFYMETTLDNLSAPCNSSPTFSNKPIAIPCNGQAFCYNHGALDPDGDSLVYSFSTPRKTSASVVSYLGPWTSSNFLTSSTFITLDHLTGDICFNPSMNMSTITGVKVEQWRTINGTPTLIGTTQRDLQFHVKSCNNQIPVLSGIDTLNTHTYNPNDTIHYMSWPIGKTIDFDINGYDADTAMPNCNAHPDEFSIMWNNGIPYGSFTPFYNGSDSAYAHFHWQPTFADVGTSPHCFVATIQDGACPYMGVSPSKYCLTITSGVGIENKDSQNELSIYPNPSTGIFTIDFPTQSDAICHISVYSIDGKEVLLQEWRQANIDTKHKVDLSAFANGVYYIRIQQGKNIKQSRVSIQRQR